MTAWTDDFMPRDRQLFRPTIGEILARLLRARFPRDTAKTCQRRYQIEPSTSQNVVKGHVSPQSLTAILCGEGEDVFELLDAIGEALTGQSRHEWEEKKLQRIIDEAMRAKQGIERLRARRALLDESARTVADDPARSEAGEDWREARRARN